jgi:hypothetical protein
MRCVLHAQRIANRVPHADQRRDPDFRSGADVHVACPDRSTLCYVLMLHGPRIRHRMAQAHPSMACMHARVCVRERVRVCAVCVCVCVRACVHRVGACIHRVRVCVAYMCGTCAPRSGRWYRVCVSTRMGGPNRQTQRSSSRGRRVRTYACVCVRLYTQP